MKKIRAYSTGVRIMIKYIVVEDEDFYKSKIINVIDKAMFNNNTAYEVLYFSECNYKLKKEIEDTSVEKVFILDIELKSKYSGLDIAKKIRSLDWDSEIIFITNHDNMFETVHRTIFKIFCFIEKFQNMEDRLENHLKIIIDKKHDNKKFIYSNNKIDMQIYLKDILYIYRDTTERKLVIKTTNNNFLVNLNLSVVLRKLDARFKQVHRACIVNTERVNLYNWGQGYFILDTKERVDMCSRNYKGAFK